MKYAAATMLVLTAAWFAGPAAAKELLSPSEAERLGVVESWHRQVGTIGGEDSILDIQLWVNKNVQREYVEVIVPGDEDQSPQVIERIATDQRRFDGRRIGKEEAERRAKLSVLKLSRRGVTAELRSVAVDQVRLHALTRDGGVATYDGETGALLWSVRVGRPELGYGSLGINDRYVTVVNGSTMYQITAMPSIIRDQAGVEVEVPPGRPQSPVRLDNVPLHGAVNVGNHVLITITRNGLETHRLDGRTIEPGFQMFNGRALTKPTTFPNSRRAMWGTDQGFVYAISTAEEPRAVFRMPVAGTVDGGMSSASGNRYFFGTTEGRVYAIDATGLGEVLWNESIGEPVYGVPFVADERVYISSSYGHLFCLAAADGQRLWTQPARDTEQVFAKLGNLLFTRDREHHLIIIDKESGKAVSRMRNVFVEHPVINQDTDRCYLVGKGGMIQCLRPTDSELPVFRRDIPAAIPAEEDEDEATPTQPRQPAEQPSSDDEPMDDPFAGEDPFGAGEDPFGGSEDPFN